MKTPPRLALARLPTPIQPLDRLSQRWGGPRIWIKRDDFTGLELSGNKVRKLEFCLAEALAQGAKRVYTCGGVQSNHCRATALACARLGLRCHLFLRTKEHPPEPDGNHLLDLLAGAEITFVTPEEYRALEPPADGYFIPEGASNEVGAWGFAEAAKEIPPGRFDAVFHAAGSGGTSAGLVLGCALYGLDLPLVAVCVCDDSAFFHRKIDSILHVAATRWPELPGLPASRDAIEILDGFQGRGYAVNRPEEWALLREIAQTEGLVLDPVYTIKAMMGLRQAIRDGRYKEGQNLLFLHTGGLFGLFPKRAETGT